MYANKFILIFVELLSFSDFIGIINVLCEEPNLPSHLPSPPKVPSTASQGRQTPQSAQGNDELRNSPQNIFASVPPVVPPQNAPPIVPPPLAPVPPPPIAPFGLQHIILIVVPQFKTKIPNLPPWLGSTLKVSMPLTVFFDHIVYPPPPLPVPPLPFYGPYFPGGHFIKKRSPEEWILSQSEAIPTHTDNDKRPPSNESIYGAERVMLIPRLEKLLESFGLGGKSCLLRTICEAHEFPLEQHGYGLLGEVFTMLFSISRSGFAESHLSEYHMAEKSGKGGDCSVYEEKCLESLFYWEEVDNGE